MKTIRNWTVAKSNLDFQTATNMLQARAINGTLYNDIAIRLRDKMFISRVNDNITNEKFYPREILSNEWEVLVPDTNEEEKNNKVRKMMKESTCSGLTNDKIDNMTIKEIWEHLCSKMSKDQMYRMIKLYYSEKVYKEKQ